MDKTDFAAFTEQVPAGTRVRGVGLVYFGDWPSTRPAFCIFGKEGTLIRHGAEIQGTHVSHSFVTKETTFTTGWHDTAVVQFFNDDTLREVEFIALEYFVADHWQTLPEITGRAQE